jgi:serine/threonine protein kinase
LLLSDKTDSATLLLTDFGLSKQLQFKHELVNHAVGTPGYVAPELVACMQRQTPYGIEVDMWAAGVIIYIMLCGFPPFWGSNNNELFHKITTCYYGFPSPWWDHVSSGAKDLIVRLLQPDPRKRFTVEQALAHPWISQREKLQTMHLEASMAALKKFNAKRRFKMAIRATMALGKMQGLVAASAASSSASSSAADVAEQSTK